MADPNRFDILTPFQIEHTVPLQKRHTTTFTKLFSVYNIRSTKRVPNSTTPFKVLPKHQSGTK